MLRSAGGIKGSRVCTEWKDSEMAAVASTRTLFSSEGGSLGRTKARDSTERAAEINQYFKSYWSILFWLTNLGDIF